MAICLCCEKEFVKRNPRQQICEDCLTNHIKEYKHRKMKERYEYLKSIGCCPSCGMKNDNGHVYCTRCNTLREQRRKKKVIHAKGV